MSLLRLQHRLRPNYLWMVELPFGRPARFWGHRLGEQGVYEQVVYADAGETVTAPAPVPVKVPTGDLR